MSDGQVLEADDMLTRNDHHPVDSGTADHHDVGVSALRDPARGAEVVRQLRQCAAMAIVGSWALAGDQ